MSTFWVIIFFINIGTPSVSWEEFGHYDTHNACMDDALTITLKIPADNHWQCLVYCVEKENAIQELYFSEESTVVDRSDE